MRILLTIALIILSVEATAQVNSENILLSEGQNSTGEKENWRVINYALLDSINLDEFGIYYPHALTINKQNRLAIMAWDNRAVYIFELTDLNSPKKIPTRMGRGPGEYEYPFDMFLTNNSLWISDIGLRKIDAWNINSQKLVQSHKLKNVFIKPDQIAICKEITGDESLYVLSTQYGPGINNQEGILHSYNIENEELTPLKTFQKLDKESERYPYVIAGDIACSKNNELLYSGDHSGTIRKYNKAGDMAYYRTAINNLNEEPLYFLRENGSTRRNPEALKVNGNIFLINDKIYVARSRDKRGDIYGIDVYSEVDGSYLESFKIPERAKELIFTSENLISVEYREDGYDLKVYSWN